MALAARALTFLCFNQKNSRFQLEEARFCAFSDPQKFGCFCGNLQISDYRCAKPLGFPMVSQGIRLGSSCPWLGTWSGLCQIAHHFHIIRESSDLRDALSSVLGTLRTRHLADPTTRYLSKEPWSTSCQSMHQGASVDFQPINTPGAVVDFQPIHQGEHKGFIWFCKLAARRRSLSCNINLQALSLLPLWVYLIN